MDFYIAFIVREQCDVTKGIQGNGGRATEWKQGKRKSAVRRKGRVNVSNTVTQKMKTKDGVGALNRKTEQTIEKEKKRERDSKENRRQGGALWFQTEPRESKEQNVYGWLSDSDVWLHSPMGNISSLMNRFVASLNQSRSKMQENKGEKKNFSQFSGRSRWNCSTCSNTLKHVVKINYQKKAFIIIRSWVQTQLDSIAGGRSRKVMLRSPMAIE